MWDRITGLLIIILMFVIPIRSEGQTSHAVGVTNFVFSPDTLEIHIGDTVVWTNTEGTHNVNGTQTEYPDNPESFGNELGTGWVFSHVFSLTGVYNYHCDNHKGSGMIGTITVVDEVTGWNSIERDPLWSMYPNPANDKLLVAANGTIHSIMIYNATGAKVFEYDNPGVERCEISLDEFSSGLYFVKVNIDHEGTQIRRLVKR